MRRKSRSIETGAFLQLSLQVETSVRHILEGSNVPVCGLRLREPIWNSAGQADHQWTPTAYR
jgi:hypothetical protein